MILSLSRQNRKRSEQSLQTRELDVGVDAREYFLKDYPGNGNRRVLKKHPAEYLDGARFGLGSAPAAESERQDGGIDQDHRLWRARL